MKSATGSRFSIIPQGGVKEEFWEWADIEAMCRAGRLSPLSLIFVPDDNSWKKLADTELALCFPKNDERGKKNETPVIGKTGQKEEYESAIQQLHANPGDVGLRLGAAEIALAMGKTDIARDHYQEALENHPYHPRVAQEAKRNLPPSLWRSLKCLEKPPQVWEDPAAVFMFPYSRGPLYLAVPAALVFGLFWTAWTAVPAVLVISLWVIETVRSTSKGETRAPLWDAFMGDPLGRIAKPIGVATAAALEVIAVFAAAAGILVVTRMSDEPNILLVVKKSALLTVLFTTVSMLYLPAVAMLAVAPAARLGSAVNPKVVVRAIRLMEGEYLLSVLFVALLLAVAWGVGALLGAVPLVDRAFYAAATVYVLLAGSFVFGRLYARFGDELEKRVLCLRSSPE